MIAANALQMIFPEGAAIEVAYGEQREERMIPKRGKLPLYTITNELKEQLLPLFNTYTTGLYVGVNSGDPKQRVFNDKNITNYGNALLECDDLSIE